MKSIDNQPIIFTDADELNLDCSCNSSSYSQLVDFDDRIYFQLESSPCNGRLQPFDTSIESWINTDGIICGTGGYGNWIQFFYFDYEYQLFAMSFVIDTFESGTLEVRITGSDSYFLTLPGTYTLYFNNPTIYTGTFIQAVVESNNFVGCFREISIDGVASVNQLKIGIVDAETLEQIALVTPNYTIVNNKITGEINVSTLPVSIGCYRLSLADFCLNTCGQFRVYNNLFVSGRGGVYGWSAVTGFDASYQFSQNSFCAYTGEDGEVYLISQTELCEGKYYYISIVVDSTTNNSITAFVGNNFVTYPINATGYLTIGITAGSPSSTYGMNLYFFIQNTGQGPGSTCIKKVDVQIDDSDIQWNKYSDVLSIGEYSDPCKYFKVGGCNGESQFGFAFGESSFNPSIRMEGRKFQPQYDADVDSFRYASGRWTAAYADVKKKWRFNFGRLPEYVLDFMSIAFYFDNLYVNDELYFPASDNFPTITWNDADDYGDFNIELYKKNVKVVKSICTGEIASCTPIGIIVDERGLLTQDSNRILSQDGINLYEEF